MFARISASLVLSLALVSTAEAGTDTDSLAVTATVAASCTITGGTLAFGTYDTVSGAAVNGTADLSVACTKDAVATITLGQGSNADTGSTDAEPARRMSDGGTDFLAYSLFSDSGRSTVWGNTELTGKSYTAATSDPETQTVFATIEGSQDVPAAAYSDTVVATVTF